MPSFLKDLKALKSTLNYTAIKNLVFEEIPSHSDTPIQKSQRFLDSGRWRNPSNPARTQSGRQLISRHHAVFAIKVEFADSEEISSAFQG